MTEKQIRKVVQMTMDEMEKRKKLKDPYSEILQEVERKINLYFSGKDDNTEMFYYLRKIADDPYIKIIYAKYKDKMTMEKIAELFDKDISTIKRNKKRLIMELYEMMN